MHTNMVEQKTGGGGGRHRLKTSVIFSSALLLLALFAIVVSGCGKTELKANTAGETGKLQLEETNYDFGDVPVGQKVEHDFVIRNTGNGTLILGEADVKLLEGC